MITLPSLETSFVTSPLNGEPSVVSFVESFSVSRTRCSRPRPDRFRWREPRSQCHRRHSVSFAGPAQVRHSDPNLEPHRRCRSRDCWPALRLSPNRQAGEQRLLLPLAELREQRPERPAMAWLSVTERAARLAAPQHPGWRRSSYPVEAATCLNMGPKSSPAVRMPDPKPSASRPALHESIDCHYRISS